MHRKILLSPSYFFFFFGAACEILLPWPGIKLTSLALGAESLNHWTTREVPLSFLSSHFLTFISLHCSPRIPDSILWKWYLGLSDTGICFLKKILFVFQMITLQVLNLSSLEQSILKSSWLFTLRFYPGSFN